MAQGTDRLEPKGHPGACFEGSAPLRPASRGSGPPPGQLYSVAGCWAWNLWDRVGVGLPRRAVAPGVPEMGGSVNICYY